MPPADVECLAIVAEECGEAVQRVGKILRFGMVTSPYTGKHNRDTLEAELGDVLAAIALLNHNGVIDSARVLAHAEEKVRGYAVDPGRVRHAHVPYDEHGVNDPIITPGLCRPEPRRLYTATEALRKYAAARNEPTDER